MKVTIIEPGGYRTDWGGVIRRAQRGAADLRRGPRTALPAAGARPFPARRPAGHGRAVLELVDSEDPPLRVFFGSSGLDMARREYMGRLESWERWNGLSIRAQGETQEP